MSDAISNPPDGLEDLILRLNRRYRAPVSVSGTVCYQIELPDSYEFLVATNELLSRLAFLSVWDTDETTFTPEQCAALGSAIKLLECEVIEPVSPFPVGVVIDYAGGEPFPDGWALCNGGAFNKNDFPELFAAIGYIYGGSGDFPLLPDYVGRFRIGATEAGQYNLGTIGGSATHQLTIAEMPAHTHSHNRAATSDANGPRHMHGTSGTGTTQSGSTGSGDAHNNMPPYRASFPIIRAVP